MNGDRFLTLHTDYTGCACKIRSVLRKMDKGEFCKRGTCFKYEVYEIFAWISTS